MMYSRIVARFLHCQSSTLNAAEKSALATLRKKTGYTISNCKKALEMHDNNLPEAEKWLRQQAQAMGWSKATKLGARKTTQGLIGVAAKDQNATLIEVNCETDFVARNVEFQKMVEEAAKTCLEFTKAQPGSGALTKIHLDSEQVKNLKASDGKSLADHLALMIGVVGENASLKRAFCLKSSGNVFISSYAHPSSGSESSIQLGRLGGLVAWSPRGDAADLETVAKEICQHVVGMNPKKVGSEDDKPAKDKDDEICLINQDFLLDDSVTVQEILDENQLDVVDFVRFECGEELNQEAAGTPLQHVETCQ